MKNNVVFTRDFNDIVSNNDKWGGRRRNSWSFKKFRGFFRSNELINIRYGVLWTWCSI